MKRVLLLAIGLLATAAAPQGNIRGNEVEVVVDGVRNASGHVLVAICREPEFLQPHCAFQGSAPAHPGAVTVRIADVPPGTYAAQCFHDETDAGRIHRTLLGMPKEGMGFSNDARFHFGPPSFRDAAFTVGPTDVRIAMNLRYYD